MKPNLYALPFKFVFKMSKCHCVSIVISIKVKSPTPLLEKQPQKMIEIFLNLIWYYISLMLLIAFAKLLLGHRNSVTLFWSHCRILRRPDMLQVAKCCS